MGVGQGCFPRNFHAPSLTQCEERSRTGLGWAVAGASERWLVAAMSPGIFHQQGSNSKCVVSSCATGLEAKACDSNNEFVQKTFRRVGKGRRKVPSLLAARSPKSLSPSPRPGPCKLVASDMTRVRCLRPLMAAQWLSCPVAAHW